MSFRRYESYCDSGVEWIGPMPMHWEIKPLLAVASECDRSNHGMIETNLLSLSYGRIVRKDINDNDGLLPESFETYQIVEPNDIVWRLTDLQNDKRSLRTALVEERGIITSAYLATKLANISPRYLGYLLRAYDLQKVFYSMGGGIRQGMNFSDVKRLPILIPPEADQIAISAFLDQETAKIDALVEAQQRLIELLKEKRQVIIAEAVRNGLKPGVPSRDSGVRWLGKIPAHWEMKPLKFVAGFQSGGTPSRDREDYWDGDIPWASAKDLKCDVLTDTDEHITAKALEDGAAQLTAVGSVLVLVRGMMLARALPVCEVAVPMAINQDLKALVAKGGMRGPFLAWALRGTQRETLNRLDESGHGTKALRMDNWTSMMMPVPPLREQDEIADHLKKEAERCDQLEEKSKATIGLLLERRSALISAAATGKIDVRSNSASKKSNLDQGQIRRAVGAAIVEAIAHKPNSGRTKTHKIIYLTQAHAGVHELGGVYQREAAGPLDIRLIEDMEAELQKVGHIGVEQPGGRGSQVTYKIRGERGSFRKQLDLALGSRAKALDELIADLGDLDTKSVEAIATLYAVWNDALLDGHSPSDDSIVAGVLDDWHPEKRKKFTAQQLHIWLNWMRRHAIVPEGRAPKTTRGRLFA